MKGIREAAMSKDEPKVPPYPSHGYQPRIPYQAGRNYSSDIDDYDDEFTYRPSQNIYKQPKTYIKNNNIVTISCSIDIDDIGPCADDTSQSYNWDKATEVAGQIAYDRITKFIGKEFEANCTMEVETQDNYTEFEVTITLTLNS